MKHLLKLSALTPKEILHILDVADEYKRLHKQGVDPKDLQGKAVALIFAKNSTRTRTSLEVGIYQMGGLGTYLSANDLQTARGEPVQDTARALGRYYDAIVCRTYKQTTLDAMAQYSGVPVISGMTDYAHPLQVLTDLMTVREHKAVLEGLKMCYIGDGNNMANSWIEAAMYFPFQLNMAIAPGYEPDQQLLALALQSGAKIFLTHDPKLAVDGANYIYADVWASMGQEEEQKKREEAFKGFCVDSELMSLAAPGVKFLHCLPAHRGEEVTDEVMESEASIVWDEAENRLHAQKAILEWVFSD